MTESTVTVSLTFAEIAFVTATSEAAEALASQLHLPTSDDVSSVAEAGLASLQVRGLARIVGNDVELAPAPNAVAALLDRCTAWIDLMFVQDEQPMSMFVASSPDCTASLLVSALAPGCFRFDVLDPALSASERVGSVVDAIVAGEGDNGMYLQRRDDDTTRIVVACDAAGAWLLADGDDTVLAPSTRVAARAAVEAAAARILTERRTTP